jgi:uncharacterized protein YndB with AHSA1/START domain
MPDPVKVSVEIARPRQQVFDYVDVLANHEAWRKNLYKDWRFEGPKRGVGAIARATPDAPTSNERIEIKVVASRAPEEIVEEIESAHGKRQTTETYRFTEVGEGRTRIELEVAWGTVPKSERIAPFVSRAFMARAQGKSLKLLAAQLEKG